MGPCLLPSNPSRANRKLEQTPAPWEPPAQTWATPSLAHGYCADKGLAWTTMWGCCPSGLPRRLSGVEGDSGQHSQASACPEVAMPPLPRWTWRRPFPWKKPLFPCTQKAGPPVTPLWEAEGGLSRGSLAAESLHGGHVGRGPKAAACRQLVCLGRAHSTCTLQPV